MEAEAEGSECVTPGPVRTVDTGSTNQDKESSYKPAALEEVRNAGSPSRVLGGHG